MHLNRESCSNDIEWENLQQMSKEFEDMCLYKKHVPRGLSAPTRSYKQIYNHYFTTDIFVSNTACPFHEEPPWEGGTKCCIN